MPSLSIRSALRLPLLLTMVPSFAVTLVVTLAVTLLAPEFLAPAASARIAQDAKKDIPDNLDFSDKKLIAGDGAAWGSLSEDKAYVVCYFEGKDPESLASLAFVGSLSRFLPGRNVEFAAVTPDSEQSARAIIRRISAPGLAVYLDSDRKIGEMFNRGQSPEGRKYSIMITNGRKSAWRGNSGGGDFTLILSLASQGRFDVKLAEKSQPMYASLKESLRLKNFRDAFRTYDEIILLSPKVFGGVAVEKYLVMIRDAKNPAGARAWGEEMLVKYAADSNTLAQLADTIVTSDEIKNRDFDLANRASDAMAKLVPPHDDSALSLRAKIFAAQGRYPEAQELQYEAWMSANEYIKADRRKVLDEYRRLAKRADAKAKTKAESPAAEPAPGIDAPAGDVPAGEKPSGEKSAGEKPTAETPSGDGR